MILKDKKILIAVTGSIAIYKSLELIRLYIKSGAIVKVIMTKSAKKFINPITFEAISQNKILDEKTENWDKNEEYNHIDIGKWSDIFIIAPATANTINKLSCGIASNLLLQTALAYNKKILLAPSANTNMLNNPITISNLNTLASSNYEIIPTQTKELICKDFGDGAMAEPIEIFHKTTRFLLKDTYWEKRKVIISGGGTSEKIDDVRCISNFSSGKMALELAKALYYMGADIYFVSTKEYQNIPNEINFFKVESSEQMKNKLLNLIENSYNDTKKPFLFMVAAVSDYIPINYKSGKLKKDSIGEEWNLKLIKNIDILEALPKKALITIGFKAEFDILEAKKNAFKMLEKKSLDVVCLNVLSDSNNFGSDNNKIELIMKENSFSYEGSKFNISIEIIQKLQKVFYND